MTKFVVVAGATSPLGQFVIRSLHRDGHKVRALVPEKETWGASRLEEAVKNMCSEVLKVDVRKPNTLAGTCDGADCVISCVGMSTFFEETAVMAVEYEGNMNLLHQAQSAGIKHFVFVSMLGYDAHRKEITRAEARERVVDELKKIGTGVTGDAAEEGGEEGGGVVAAAAGDSGSTMKYSIFRPSMLFDDLAYVFYNAKRGYYVTIGEGRGKMNPIHPADLADAIAEAVASPDMFANRTIELGGPQVMNFESVIALAREISDSGSGNPYRVPAWFMNVGTTVSAGVNPKFASAAKLWQICSVEGLVAEKFGRHTLRDYYEDLDRGKELDDGFREVFVHSGSKHKIEFHILTPNTEIHYKFRVRDRDIDFGIYFKDESKDALLECGKEVRRYDNGCLVEAVFTCPKRGLYVLQWDNTYSVMRKKVVHYKIEIVVPDSVLREQRVRDYNNLDSLQKPESSALVEGDALLAALDSDSDSDSDDSDASSSDDDKPRKSAPPASSSSAAPSSAQAMLDALDSDSDD